jgi:hypothetical protein
MKEISEGVFKPMMILLTLPSPVALGAQLAFFVLSLQLKIQLF